MTLDLLQLPLQGNCLLEASAGTGKTFSLTALYLRLLLEEKIPLQQILVVSFTKASARDLQEKIRHRLKFALEYLEADNPPQDHFLAGLFSKIPDLNWAIQWLTLALRSFDEAQIQTIDSFCTRSLKENSFEARLLSQWEVTPDLRDLDQEIIQDYWAQQTFHLPLELVKALKEAKFSPSSLVNLLHSIGNHDQVELVYHTYLPGLPAQKTLTHAFHALREAKGELVAARAFLLQLDCFDRRKIKPNSLETWFQEVERFLQQSSPLPIPKELERICPNTLEAANKGEAISFPAVFTLVENLVAQAQTYQQEVQGWINRLQVEFYRYWQQERPQRLEQARQKGFKELLQALHRALRGPRGQSLLKKLQSQYQAALVDEFQDTNPLQYEIFSRIFNQRRFYMIGDAKQAIYAFRGADIHAYFQAKQDAEALPPMDVNWRSDPGLIEALNQLYQRRPNPFQFHFIPYVPVAPRPEAANGLIDLGAPIELVYWPKGDEPASSKNGPLIAKGHAFSEIPRFVAQQVYDSLTGGGRLLTPQGPIPLEADHIAILAQTNQEGEAIRRALEEKGIPVTALHRKSIFYSLQVNELDLILLALLTPRDTTKVRAALATRLMGLNAAAIHLLGKEEQRLAQWISTFEETAKIWHQQGIARALRRLFDHAQTKVRLLNQQGGTRWVTNLTHLIELLTKQERNERLKPQELYDWLSKKQQTQSEEEEEAFIRMETGAKAVSVLTLHKSKGLEYPIVYCPYLWSSAKRKQARLFHDPVKNQLSFALDSETKNQYQELIDQECLQEALRLQYVGLTRAKHKLVLYYGMIAGMFDSSLTQLLFGETLQPKDKDLAPKIQQSLTELCRVTGIKLKGLPSLDHQLYSPQGTAPLNLDFLRLDQPLDTRHRVSSFSGLTRLHHTAPGPLWLERLEGEDAVSPSIEVSHPIALKSFPKGAKAGNFFHDLLEKIDFTRLDNAETWQTLQRECARYGFVYDAWKQPLERFLSDFLHTPLDPAPSAFALKDLPPQARWNELDFLFPVKGNLTPFRLAQRLRPFERELGLVGYAEEVEQLEFQHLRGFLKGFIDLVYFWQGRYHLLDYKSNHLGDEYADYSPSKMNQCMRQHHYPLQMLFYSLALHRLLKIRLKNYHPTQHLGDCHYLFLRGMRPSGGEGVYPTTPPFALIESLDQLMEGQ